MSTKAGPEEKIGLIMMLQIRLGAGLTMGTGNTGPGLETSLKPGSLFSLQHGIKKREKKERAPIHEETGIIIAEVSSCQGYCSIWCIVLGWQS